MNTSVELCGVTLKNPVMTASGTFGSGAEYSEFTDLNRLGAVVTKGVANVPWPGNPTPRVAEVYGGMLNAVGLQNPGIDLFCERDIPFLKKYDTKIIVNVCGHSTEEYVEVVKRLAEEPVDMLEINISCPNVKEGGIFSVIFCGLLSGIFITPQGFFPSPVHDRSECPDFCRTAPSDRHHTGTSDLHLRDQRRCHAWLWPFPDTGSDHRGRLLRAAPYLDQHRLPCRT